ncbi:MAG: MATE family efflux transporter [Anaerovoracaceae bacterium]|jgi:multidrug efflux pump
MAEVKRADPVRRKPAEDKMAVMPVSKLILNMGFPMMLSMLGQALYNVVDTFFVSRIPDSPGITNAGEMAINALTLAFPVQMLIMALGVGTGVGVNALVSRLLGMKQRREAENAAGNALFVSMLYYLAMLLFGIFGAEPFIESQTDNEVIAAYGIRYVTIISVLSLGTLGYMCLEKVTIATGRTKVTMITQIAGALTNILLDPVLIYGWLGLPALGVRGAAIATVIGQFVSLISIGTFYLGGKRILSIRRADLRPRKHILGALYRIGIPAIAMQILVPLMSYAMNLILVGVSEAAVTAYGIYYKLQNFIFMPGYGLNNASIPIISFNFGAGKKDRIARAIRWALTDVTVIMLIGVVLLEGWTKPIVGLFSVTPETEVICVTALRIIVWGFFFAGANIILQGVCQALGNGNFSLIISLVRLIAVPLPAAFALAHLAQAKTAVWFSIPLGELSACVVAVILTTYLYKRKVGKI